MSGDQKSMRMRVRTSIRKIVFGGPWRVLAFVFRVLYGFHVEGQENVPEQWPFILGISEHSLISMVLSGWISVVMLGRAMTELPEDDMVSYLHEELFRFSFFQKALQDDNVEARFNPLIPHSAGRLSLSLLDGYHALRRNGVVVINPEGDATFDGRPVPIKNGLAWMALHSGAPVVPAIVTIGGYDIWPRWQRLPSLRGRLRLRVGQPFTLTDEPLRRATDEDLQTANARVRQEFDRLVYGPGGIDAWAGPVKLNGRVVSRPVELVPASAPVTVELPNADDRGGPDLTWLLWRCPVCGTDEALAHKRPWLRRQTLTCRACATGWELQRRFEQDFRLKVIQGHPDIVGLDMALTCWYDAMKDAFRPNPIAVTGVELLPGEEVYLEKPDVQLLPHQPSALFDGWSGREPPTSREHGKPPPAEWESIGLGRMLLTNKRMVWQGPQGELDFMWGTVTAVAIWLQNILGIRYGTARYRFPLTGEIPLKWLFYAGTMAQRAPRSSGHELTLSKY